MATTFELVLLYLLAAVAGVVACRLPKLPPILGYLLAGVAIGPHALALAKDSAGFSYLGEFAVVLLTFVLGLEFNLPRLHSMCNVVFGLGLSQVLLSIVGAVLGDLLLRGALSFTSSRLDPSWRGAVALGAAMAMSSTAIVVKLMVERLELESEHGRGVPGVLLFQDLAVVPLLVLIPALDLGARDIAESLGWAALEATALLTLLLVGGPRAVRWWLTLVARRKSEELSILNLLLTTLGLAWLTEDFGLWLALGAFVAGMLIAGTRVQAPGRDRYQALPRLAARPVLHLRRHEARWRAVAAQWHWVAALTLLPVLFKFGLVTALARLFGAQRGVAMRAGLYLAQAGEFGFVLLTLAMQEALLPPALQSPVLAAMVLSMLVALLIILYSNRIVMKLSASDWSMQSVAVTTIARRAMNAESHVIIAGYGRSGQNLARILEGEHVPYIALDLDPDRVRQAAAAGQSVVFGDAARLASLMAAGLARASAVVVSYHNTPSALRTLHLVRSRAPNVPVVVRTLDDSELEPLRAAGAAEVVPEAVEGSPMLASRALALVGVPIRRVIRVVQKQRDARYALLRSYFHGADDDTVNELRNRRLLSVTLAPDSHLRGRRLADLPRLHALDVTVVSVRWAGGGVLEPSDELLLEGGDAPVLSGLPEPLALAEAKLLSTR